MRTPQGSPLPPARRLIIVEDESILALDIERSLRAGGFDVRGVAADADEAVALVERERPDLVLMDIRLQGPRDGIEAALILKERFDVPVVFLTANSDPRTMDRAQQSEPMGYLLKPFKKPDLHNVVSIALARSARERALKLREQFLEATLGCIGEAIVSADGEGRTTYLNRAGEQLLSRPAAEVLSRPLHEVLRLETRDGQPLPTDPVTAAQARGEVRFEATLPVAEGARAVEGTAAEVRQGEARLGVVLALRDVTERLKARRQLEFSERLASLGTLAAGVAHEVNNPLSVVISNVGFALDAYPEQDETWEALADARDAAQRVAGIVDGLRSFSSPHLEPLRAIDPREALGAALHLTHGQWRKVAGVRLDLQPVPMVLASAARLTQVYVTLIINAVQAMQATPGPHVLDLSTATDADGGAVTVVRDDGPGVPLAAQPRIWDPFFTTKPPGQGTGLGLSIARSIVEHHAGALTLEPGGVGAAFAVRLPATPGAPPEPRAPLDAWWVGPALPEAALLGSGRRLDGVRPDQLAAVLAGEVLLVSLPPDGFRALRDSLPDLEHRALLVGEGPVEPGFRRLLRPFDARAVSALVRRGEPGPRRAR